jgi:hypothetical protein
LDKKSKKHVDWLDDLSDNYSHRRSEQRCTTGEWEMAGYSIFFTGERGTCRDYFDAASMLDAVCQFYALRGKGYPIHLVREHS